MDDRNRGDSMSCELSKELVEEWLFLPRRTRGCQPGKPTQKNNVPKHPAASPRRCVNQAANALCEYDSEQLIEKWKIHYLAQSFLRGELGDGL